MSNVRTYRTPAKADGLKRIRTRNADRAADAVALAAERERNLARARQQANLAAMERVALAARISHDEPAKATRVVDEVAETIADVTIFGTHHGVHVVPQTDDVVRRAAHRNALTLALYRSAVEHTGNEPTCVQITYANAVIDTYLGALSRRDVVTEAMIDALHTRPVSVELLGRVLDEHAECGGTRRCECGHGRLPVGCVAKH